MKIGLYGLPTAGKTTILSQIDFAPVLIGSDLLRKIAPSFSTFSDSKQNMVRKRLAQSLREKDSFLMDGHYSFGEKTVFTDEDFVLGVTTITRIFMCWTTRRKITSPM